VSTIGAKKLAAAAETIIQKPTGSARLGREFFGCAYTAFRSVKSQSLPQFLRKPEERLVLEIACGRIVKLAPTRPVLRQHLTCFKGRQNKNIAETQQLSNHEGMHAIDERSQGSPSLANDARTGSFLWGSLSPSPRSVCGVHALLALVELIAKLDGVLVHGGAVYRLHVKIDPEFHDASVLACCHETRCEGHKPGIDCNYDGFPSLVLLQHKRPRSIRLRRRNESKTTGIHGNLPSLSLFDAA
jgi:hypothetical protein